MIRVGNHNGVVCVIFEGQESGAEMRKFIAELTQIVGRGSREFSLGGQKVYVQISNVGAPPGEHHQECA